MNERIKELAKQCSTTSTSYFDGRGNVTSTVFDKEKFAELIVKECSAYVEGTGNWLVAMEMKQYFGVEE